MILLEGSHIETSGTHSPLDSCCSNQCHCSQDGCSYVITTCKLDIPRAESLITSLHDKMSQVHMNLWVYYVSNANSYKYNSIDCYRYFKRQCINVSRNLLNGNTYLVKMYADKTLFL